MDPRFKDGGTNGERRSESGAWKQYLVDGLKDVGRESVGGQDRAQEDLLNVLTADLVESELAKRYRIGGPSSMDSRTAERWRSCLRRTART